MSSESGKNHGAARSDASDVLVIGAGLSGLVAARELRAAGRGVLLVDKGRGVGGRLATRRLDGATFDHGAQFIAPRGAEFTALVETWVTAGVLAPWPVPVAGGHSCWRGVPAMTGLAKHLARDLDVRLATRVTALRRGGDLWTAVTEDGHELHGRAALLTAPVPQSLALLAAGGVVLPAALRADLEAVAYEPCLAVLAVPAGAVRVPAPGWHEPGGEPLTAIIDNRAKGVSTAAAVTLLATPAFSRAHWDRDRQESGRALLTAAAPWLGGPVASSQVHAWLYSRPLGDRRDGCVVLQDAPRLVIAGDAFGGPDLEGAALSGLRAALALA
jgi:hypothetical protein